MLGDLTLLLHKAEMSKYFQQQNVDSDTCLNYCKKDVQTGL